jgi:hypothetical protein
VKLKTAVPISGGDFSINTICLPQKDHVFDEQMCTVTGWGRIKEGETNQTRIKFLYNTMQN